MVGRKLSGLIALAISVIPLTEAQLSPITCRLALHAPGRKRQKYIAGKASVRKKNVANWVAKMRVIPH